MTEACAWPILTAKLDWQSEQEPVVLQDAWQMGYSTIAQSRNC